MLRIFFFTVSDIPRAQRIECEEKKRREEKIKQETHIYNECDERIVLETNTNTIGC